MKFHEILSGIAALYRGKGADAAQVRAAHLGAITRLTPYTMAANMGNGLAVLWAFRDNLPAGLLPWFATLLMMSGFALQHWWRRRGRAFEKASTRAARHATLHAFALAAVWAVLPVAWFPSASPSQQLLLATLLTGMLGAGTFVLNPMPLASIGYALVFAAGCLGALWRAGDPMGPGVAALLLCYTAIVIAGSLVAWRKSTALLHSRAQAVRQERMLAVLLQDFEQHAGDALWETGTNGHLTHLSPRLAELLRLSDEESARFAWLTLLESRCAAGLAELRTALECGHPFRDLRLTVRDGEARRHLSINGKRLIDDDGRTFGWRGVVADVTEKVKSEERLRQLAHTDPLTGLANRVTLREALREAMRGSATGALLMIDLDHFKAVNDSLGHSAGDDLLRAVSGRLSNAMRPGDLVARLGGDEFAVHARQVNGTDEAMGFARRLVDILSQPFDIRDRRVRAGASVGVAAMDGNCGGVDDILARADMALYAAKEAGRGRAAIYSPQLGELSRRRSTLEDGLRHAAGSDQFRLHWQPKVDIATWQICGAEALLRWEHPSLGRINPVEFIAVAESCGRIDELGRWALNEACRTAASMLDGLTIAVNVSPAQLRGGRFVDTVRDALRNSGLAAERLELEITESVFMDDAHGVLDQLHALRGLGARIALDDFGTGYSSLAYLRRFPFDTLKIDKAFVGELLLRKDARAIVHTITQLAATLGMRTVSEGVETREQLVALAGAGCDEIQGYLVSPPRPLVEFTQFRRDWKAVRPDLTDAA